MRAVKYLLLSTAVLGSLYVVLNHSLSKPLSLNINSVLSSIYTNPQANTTKTTRPLQLPSSHATITNTSALAWPTIGKVTASFGPPDASYEAAIATHLTYSSLHNHPTFILREQILSGLWSKHAYLLSILGHELSKPEAQRLKWLFWHDRDTILMNAQIPLEIFLPPEPEFNHISLLATRDRNGLNNGVFFVRVGEWALKMFASALSIREYQPDVVLKYTEQSAMEETLKRPYYNASVAWVPQRWFNGFPPQSSRRRAQHTARPGSLLIHFASNRDGRRPERMAHWMGERAKWDVPLNTTMYAGEVEEYWARVAKGEGMETVSEDIGKRLW